MALPLPSKCEIETFAGVPVVTFEVALDGRICRACITLARLDQLYPALADASEAGKTEHRLKAVSLHSELTRMVVERIEAGEHHEPVILE